MYKIYNISSTGNASTSIIPILALVVSIFSIVCTLYYIYLSKRIEIINSKFQKFCIGNLDELFKTIDSNLNSHELEVEKFKKIATDLFVEVQLYITILKKIYPKINIVEIIFDIETYTDFLYSNKEIPFVQIKAGYITVKLKIYASLYNYALHNELNFFERLGFKTVLKKFLFSKRSTARIVTG